MASKITNYIRETKAELKGVNWLTKKQIFIYTIMVIVASLGVAIFLGVFDMASAFLLKKFVL